MAKQQEKQVNTTQPEKDRDPHEDTYEKDNNTNVAATPKSTLTTSEPPPEDKKSKKSD
jgi:hypothetical protein